ncbi:MAG: alpha/beta hydrolase [Myxococcota bacterium]
MEQRSTRYGQLTAHLQGQPNGEGPIVALLHGFGAPGTDLVPLGDHLDVPGATFVFFEAPLTMPPPFDAGRAWWMIDVTRFQTAVLSNELHELERQEPEGLTAAASLLNEALDAMQADLGPSRPLVLGGFSQGSMLALDHALSGPRPLSGLVLWSSTLIARDRWTDQMRFRAQLPCFQSHGTEDPVLPFVQAQKLRSLLEDHGLDVTWRTFQGGHGIPPSVVSEASAFMRKCTAGPGPE